VGGGGGGSSRSIGDIKSLMEKAKKELRRGEKAGRRNVFISFAMEDEAAVKMLRASTKNPNSPIEFNDWSVSEPYDSDRAPYIKQKIAERIAQSSVTVVFLSHAVQKSKWVQWEVEESIRQGKHVLAVYSAASKPGRSPDVIQRHGIQAVAWADLAGTIAKLP
jgi:antiphage defense system Thoeris ThsB-like protein